MSTCSRLAFILLAAAFMAWLPNSVRAADIAGAAGPIMAGKRIGDVHVRDTDAHVRSVLGQPAGQDMAMGREICVWNLFQADNPTQFDVLFRRDDSDNQLHATDIRVNSNAFRAANGITAGSSLAEIKKHYPDVKPVQVDSPEKKLVYDSIAHGIAFEMDGDKCASVIVHAPGQGVRISYVSLP